MTFFEAVFLGVVQGLTEFLPVSSSGHLVLTEALLGLRTPGILFEVILHVATLLAVVWVYRARVLELASGTLRGDRPSLRYVGLIVLASVPAGLTGVFGKEFFERQFAQPLVVAMFLIVTGVIVYTVHLTRRHATDPEPSAVQALWIGLGQALAILPGISRSGTTVALGSWRGVEVIRLAEFSFLLSIPAILGAGLLQVLDVRAVALGAPAAVGVDLSAGAIAAAFAAALVSGVFAIKLFIRMLEQKHFTRFSYYCWTAGGLYLLAAFFVPELR